MRLAREAWQTLWVKSDSATELISGVLVPVVLLVEFANSNPHPVWFWSAAVVLLIATARRSFKFGTALFKD